MQDICDECGAPRPAGLRCGSCGALPVQPSSSPAPQPRASPPRPPRPKPVTRPGDAPRRSRRYPAPPTEQAIIRAADTRISPQSKLGVLFCHLIFPFGGARFYAGHYTLGIVQTLVSLLTCGIGGLWPIIDGFVMLGTTPRDAHGRVILGGKKRKKALAAEAEAVMLELPAPPLD